MEYLKNVQESDLPLDTHHFLICKKCLPHVGEDITMRKYPRGTPAYFTSLDGAKAKNMESSRRARAEQTRKLSILLFWWRLRGFLWVITSLVSIWFNISGMYRAVSDVSLYSSSM